LNILGSPENSHHRQLRDQSRKGENKKHEENGDNVEGYTITKTVGAMDIINCRCALTGELQKEETENLSKTNLTEIKTENLSKT
jgi:hypothetical protein